VRRRYFAFDAADTLSKFMVNGLPDPAYFSQIIISALVTAKVASENPRPQVVAFEAAIQLERLWNDLAHTNSFSLLCAYPSSQFSGMDDISQLSKICDEHSDVVGSPFCRIALE